VNYPFKTEVKGQENSKITLQRLLDYVKKYLIKRNILLLIVLDFLLGHKPLQKMYHGKQFTPK